MLLIFTVSCYCFLWLWFDACNQTVRFYPFRLRFKESACFSTAMFSMSWAVLGSFLRHRLLAKRERPFNGQHSAFSLSLCGSLPFEGPWLRGGGGLKPTARTLACQKLLESIRAFFYLSFSLSVSISLSPAISLPRGHDPFWHQPAPYRPSLHLSMFTKFSVGAVWKTDARTYQI